MHAGNIYAALVSWLIVKSHGGDMVLRIEDLDRERSKAAYIDDVCRDFEQLGLTWDRGPIYQHDRDDAYAEAFQCLSDQGLVYPCFCSRADLHAASAPHRGEKLVYPGTCRNLTEAEREQRAKKKNPAMRLKVPAETIGFDDMVQGPYAQKLDTDCGDFLVRRSDNAFAYQLAVVVDDAYCGVNCVVRGVDLLCSTPQQIFLQGLLGLETPRYAHVPLLVAQQNRRLSKRDHDASIDQMMQTFKDARGVIGHIAYIGGLQEADEPCWPEDLLAGFDVVRYRDGLPDKVQLQWR